MVPRIKFTIKFNKLPEDLKENNLKGDHTLIQEDYFGHFFAG